MAMRSLEDNEAEDFHELICPECGRNHIQEYKALSGDYDKKRDKLLHASRCTNEDCPKGRLSPDEVSIQLANSGITQTITKLISGGKTPFVIIFILLVAGFLGFQLLSGSDTTTVAVSGEITHPDGNPVQNAIVHINGNTVTTNTNGQYTINVPPGKHTIYVEPTNKTEYGYTQPTTISVSQDGTVDTTKPHKSLSIQNNSLSISLKHLETYTTTQEISQKQFIVNVNNWRNLQNKNVQVTFNGQRNTNAHLRLTEGTTTHSIKTKQLTNPHATIIAPATHTATTSQFTKEHTYTGPLTGTDPFISLQGTTRSQSHTYTSSGSTSFTIAGKTPTTVKATVVGNGGTTSLESRTGTYTGTDPTLSLGKETETTVSITGNIQTQEKQTSGPISPTVTETVSGNLDAQNVQLKFSTGTTSNSSKPDTTSLSASGVNGEKLKKTEIITAQTSGTYIINTEFTVDQNENLVSAGYAIGKSGDLQTVPQGTNQIEVSLEKGQTLYTWIRSNHKTTTNESSGQNQFGSDGSDIVDVTGYTVSKTNVQKGESVTVRANLANTGDRRGGAKTILWKNGKKVFEKRIYVEKGQQKTIKLASVTFDKTGSVGVNGLEPTIIRVNSDGKYGVGSLTTSVSKQSSTTTGNISVDVGNDGTIDCNTTRSGSCNLNTLSPTQHQFSFSGDTQGVSYTLSYTEQVGQKGVTIDINGDGTPEITHTGLLQDGTTKQATTTLPAGDNTIDISITNGTGLNYTIDWQQSASSIHAFTTTIDGSQVVSETTVTGKKTFTFENISPGEHTIKFHSNSNQQYTVNLQWAEYQQSSAPTITLDGQTVCQPTDFTSTQLRCSLPASALSNGQHTISASTSGNYSFGYMTTNVASTVELTVNGETHTIKKNNANTVHPDGSWKTTLPLPNLQTAQNTFQLDTTGGQTTTVIKYNAPNRNPKNPHLTVTAPNGTTKTLTIPQSERNSDGTFTSTYSTSVPAKWFGNGENTLSVKTNNSIAVHTSLSLTTTANQTYEFNKK